MAGRAGDFLDLSDLANPMENADREKLDCRPQIEEIQGVVCVICSVTSLNIVQDFPCLGMGSLSRCMVRSVLSAEKVGGPVWSGLFCLGDGQGPVQRGNRYGDVYPFRGGAKGLAVTKFMGHRRAKVRISCPFSSNGEKNISFYFIRPLNY